jgi:hypothetical protein
MDGPTIKENIKRGKNNIKTPEEKLFKAKRGSVIWR